MLTGEYLVLDGAMALAIPTRFGQSMKVEASRETGIQWTSLDKDDQVWYKGAFIIEEKLFKLQQDDELSVTLVKILQQVFNMNPNLFAESPGWSITTKLDFPIDWGLGTSSTLINNVAQWAQIDPFTLLSTSFGGSGYDVAAAQFKSPILYKTIDGSPSVEAVTLHWDFTDRLFFVHLNRKQDSKEGIAHYRQNSANIIQLSTISAISHSLLGCGSLSEFENLVRKHESIISEIINMPTIKEQLFSDYPLTIKSLGAWGGDFILATGTEKDHDYFRSKGYNTIIPFADMIL